MLLLCVDGQWFGGAVLRVAGANFFVNQKLEQVEQIKETLEDTTTELKQQPKVNRLKIQAIYFWLFNFSVF